MNGEVGLEKIVYTTGLYKEEFIAIGQGGHRWNKNMKLQHGAKTIPDPPIFDEPYEAAITIKYRSSFIPKKRTSSLFPENWSLQRIQEEVAWVYENTVAKGESIYNDTGKFMKYRFFSSTSEFKILIEVDSNGNIMNSYPHIK